MDFDFDTGMDEKDLEQIQDHMMWRRNVGEIYSLFRERDLQGYTYFVEWLGKNLAVIGSSKYEEEELEENPEQTTEEQEEEVEHEGKTISYVSIIEPESGKVVWESETDSAVNRARVYKKDGSQYIAIICASGTVLVFAHGTEKAPLELKSHEENGFGLAWSSEGLLATATDDGELNVWTIDFAAWTAEKTASQKLEHGVNELQWKYSQLLSACEDGYVRVFTTDLKLGQEIKANEEGATNCVAVNPFSDNMIATSGSDNTISLWDLRTATSVATIYGHEGKVNSIKFSPHIDGLIASAADDNRVIIWDISKFGATQDPDEVEEGPPEILFIHSGHLKEVNDVAWHPTRPWVLASVPWELNMHVWSPNELSKGEPKPVELPASLVVAF